MFEVIGDDPKVLFVSDISEFEIRQNKPFTGDAGKILREFVQPLLPSYILCNIDDKRNLLPLVEYDIRMVVIFGINTAEILLPDIDKKKTTVASLIKKGAEKLEDGRFYVVDYGMGYILKKGGSGTPSHKQWSNRIRRLIQPYIPADNSILQKIKEQEHKVKWSVIHPDELIETLDFLRTWNGLIGFDYETILLDPWDVNNRITGFGLAIATKEKAGRAFFVDLKQRDLTDEEVRIFLDFLHEKKPVVYNAKFERNVTWAKFGEQVDFNDAYTLCKLDNNKGGLKDNARYYLESDFVWEEVNGEIISLFESIYAEYDKIGKLYPTEFAPLIVGDIQGFKEVLMTKPVLQKKCAKLLGFLSTLQGILTDVEIGEGIQARPWAWGAVPARILGHYCCIDSYMALQIWNKLY